ncbi:MAG: glycosyltransferase family 39 protein, partial [Elusimicrobiota bacterium]
TLSLITMLDFINTKSIKWLILSGIFGGLAFSMKYTAVFFIFGLFFLLFTYKGKLTKKLKHAFIWSVIVMAVVSPWLIKNYVETNNPIHPFLESKFNVPLQHQMAPKNRKGDNIISSPLSRLNRLKKLPKMPWELGTMGGGTKKYGSPDYYMTGAVFLAIIPLLLFIKSKYNLDLLRLLIFSLLCSIAWGMAALPKVKYLAPIFPALSLMVGFGGAKINKSEKYFGKFILLIIAILVLSNFLFMVPHAHLTYKPLSILTGTTSKDKYLATSKPGYPNPSYGAYKFANENLPKNSKILIFGDAKCYYLKRKFTAFAAKGRNPLIDYIQKSSDAKDFYDLLKEKNYTHLIVNIREGIRTGNYGNLYFTPDELKILDNFWKKYVKKVYDKNHVYLYEIKKDIDRDKHPVPENTPQLTFIHYKLPKIQKLLKNKKPQDALTELQPLTELKIENYNIYYLAGVTHYYLKNFKESKSYLEKAHRIRPSEEIEELIQRVESRL